MMRVHMKKLLVTGASGFLGSRIVEFYKEKYHILAPSHTEMDITQKENVNLYFAQNKPDIVIHCAAISDTAACENNPSLSWKTNVTGSETIAQIAKQHSAKCIFCSSDQVYCGSTRSDANIEDDTLSPYNVYGKDKLFTENSCLEIDENSVHLRLAWMFDGKATYSYTRNDFMKQLKNCVKNSVELSLPINDKRGITDVWEVVENIEKTFLLPGGIYNFGSPNQKSTYETALSVLSTLHCDTSFLRSKAYDNARNLSMDQGKLNAYHIRFSSTEDALIQCLKNCI